MHHLVSRFGPTLLLTALLCSCPAPEGRAGAEQVKPASTPAAKATHDQSFRAFWGRFRSAALSGKTEELTPVTVFPFVVRWGNADPNDPRATLDRAAFGRHFPRLLELSAPGEGSMHDLLARKDYTPPAVREDVAVAGAFEFKRSASGEWRFAAAFTDNLAPFQGGQPAYSPMRGSPVRAQILDALRSKLGVSGQFQVDHLLVKSEWSYFEGTEAGKRQLQVKALGIKQSDRWVIEDAVRSQDSTELAAFDAKVKTRRAERGIPLEIFPSRAAGKGRDSR